MLPPAVTAFAATGHGPCRALWCVSLAGGLLVLVWMGCELEPAHGCCIVPVAVQTFKRQWGKGQAGQWHGLQSCLDT